MRGTIQPRRAHTSTAIQISSTLTEVVTFGGEDGEGTKLADTTVLQFSEWCGVCEEEKETECAIGETGRR